MQVYFADRLELIENWDTFRSGENLSKEKISDRLFANSYL